MTLLTRNKQTVNEKPGRKGSGWSLQGKHFKRSEWGSADVLSASLQRTLLTPQAWSHAMLAKRP